MKVDTKKLLKKNIPLLLVTVVTFAMFVNAILTAQEEYVTGDNAIIDFKSNQWVAQSFRVGSVGDNSAYDINMISLKLKNETTATGTLRFFIRATNASGYPIGNNLAENTTIPVFQQPPDANGAWVNITLNQTLTVVPDGNYSIIATSDGTTNEGNWRYDNSGSYAGGNYWQSTNGADWVGDLNNDFMFIVFSGGIFDSIVILDEPEQGDTFISDNILFNATLVSGDNQNITNATIYIYDPENSLINKTTNIVTGLNTNNVTDWTVGGFEIGKYTWGVEGCFDDGTVECVFTNNRTFNFGFLINSETFNAVVGDLSNETFTLNLTKIEDLGFSGASLIYNGISYTSNIDSDGTNTIFTRTLTTPAVTTSTNFNFSWNFTLSNGQFGIFSTPEQQQTVTPSQFVLCNPSQTTVAVNYTIFDEETQDSINNSVFDATFIWNLGGDISKNISYSISNNESYAFCISPNVTFFTDADIKLSADGYSTRTFFFNQEEFSNDTTVQPLYLLNESLGTDVHITLKDAGLFTLPDYTIKIFRKLQSGGELLVENDITDHVGTMIVRLIENDVRYRVKFFDENNNLVKEIPNSLANCITTICQKDYIIREISDAFDDFGNLIDYTSSLTFTNSTRTFNFVWIDNRGESQTHRLLVEKITFANGTEVKFNQTSVSNNGILSYNADTSSASYRVSAFRKVGNDERRVGLINIKIGDNADIFSFEGLYWSLIIFMVMLLIGRFFPVVGIVLYLFTTFLLGIFDIIFINSIILIAQFVIGVIFIWAFKN